MVKFGTKNYKFSFTIPRTAAFWILLLIFFFEISNFFMANFQIFEIFDFLL